MTDKLKMGAGKVGKMSKKAGNGYDQVEPKKTGKDMGMKKMKSGKRK